MTGSPVNKNPEEQACSGSNWVERALNPFAACLILLVPLIVLQVLAGGLGLNPIAKFESVWPLIGNAITVNTLLDAQWHLLCVIGLLPAGLVWWQDRHVRVDFLWQGFGLRTRSLVELTGHLLFTIPFLALSLPAAWRFTMRAWDSGEGSTGGGLNDLFLVKGLLPLGLALLGCILVADLVLRCRDLFNRARGPGEA
jgi:TRAP-type mannitol/chloroaromatic compound transport system permease small subunit